MVSDFSGLDALMSGAADETGAAATAVFTLQRAADPKKGSGSADQ